MPTLTTTIQHSFVSINYSNRRRKRNKRNPVVQFSLFADDMIFYIENPKDSTRKLLELINDYSKIQDIKLTHRNPLHSYTLTMSSRKGN